MEWEHFIRLFMHTPMQTKYAAGVRKEIIHKDIFISVFKQFMK